MQELKTIGIALCIAFLSMIIPYLIGFNEGYRHAIIVIPSDKRGLSSLDYFLIGTVSMVTAGLANLKIWYKVGKAIGSFARFGMHIALPKLWLTDMLFTSVPYIFILEYFRKKDIYDATIVSGVVWLTAFILCFII